MNSQGQGDTDGGREKQKETDGQMGVNTEERIRKGTTALERKGEKKGERMSQRDKEKLSGRKRKTGKDRPRYQDREGAGKREKY